MSYSLLVPMISTLYLEYDDISRFLNGRMNDVCKGPESFPAKILVKSERTGNVVEFEYYNVFHEKDTDKVNYVMYKPTFDSLVRVHGCSGIELRMYI